MIEKNSSSSHNLQKKFQKWFRDPVPADSPVPAEPDHSIGESVPSDIHVPAETDNSVGNPVPADLPYPAGVDYSHYKTRRSRYNLQRLLELFSFGFSGAVLLGTSVGLITLIINISFFNWYGISWPGQFFIIFLAMAIGFLGGLFKGSVDKLNNKYS